MRTKLFFSAIFLIAGAGVILLLGGIKLPVFSGGIAPYAKWNEILPGKWKYQRKLETTEYTWVYEGEVEYKRDGTFNRFITCKYYHISGMKKLNSEYISIIAGGSYWGRWSVDTVGGFFKEDIEGCNVTTGRVDYGYKAVNFCETKFAPKNHWWFGDLVSSRSRFKVIRFDKKKIIINGELFDEAGTVEVLFDRME
jgi:hypothetical protein